MERATSQAQAQAQVQAQAQAQVQAQVQAVTANAGGTAAVVTALVTALVTAALFTLRMAMAPVTGKDRSMYPIIVKGSMATPAITDQTRRPTLSHGKAVEVGEGLTRWIITRLYLLFNGSFTM